MGTGGVWAGGGSGVQVRVHAEEREKAAAGQERQEDAVRGR